MNIVSLIIRKSKRIYKIINKETPTCVDVSRNDLIPYILPESYSALRSVELTVVTTLSHPN